MYKRFFITFLGILSLFYIMWVQFYIVHVNNELVTKRIDKLGSSVKQLFHNQLVTIPDNSSHKYYNNSNNQNNQNNNKYSLIIQEQDDSHIPLKDLLPKPIHTRFVMGNDGFEEVEWFKDTIYQCGGDNGTTEWVSDQSLLPESQGMVYFGSELSIKLYSQTFNYPDLMPGQIRAYYNLEPLVSIYSRCVVTQDCIGKFHWTFGNLYFDQIKRPPLNSFLNLITNGDKFNFEKDVWRKKNKLWSWIASSCIDEVTGLETFRTKLVRQLSEKHERVDCLGKCLQNKEMPGGGSRRRDLNFKIKIRALESYKFYLSFENSYCPEYITEKAFHCLMSGTVPIIGAHKSAFKYLPQNSFIDLDRFNNTQELYDYIKFLDTNPHEYRKYFKWREFSSKNTVAVDQYKEWIDQFDTEVTNSIHRGLPCALHNYYLSRTKSQLRNEKLITERSRYKDACYDIYERFLDNYNGTIADFNK